VERRLPEPPFSQLDIAQAVNIIAKALRSKTWREHVLKELSGILPGPAAEPSYTVTSEDIELFRARAIADGIMPRTVHDYLRHLVKFLDHVRWVLSLETLQRVYTYSESEKTKRETSKALKRLSTR